MYVCMYEKEYEGEHVRSPTISNEKQSQKNQQQLKLK